VIKEEKEMSKIHSVAFIGGGRVARILVEGWRRAGVLPSRILVVEPDQMALGLLQELAPEVAEARPGEISSCDLVFLALHPPAMQAAMKSLASELAPDAVVVTLAPKVQSAAIAEALGTKRVVRMIPNAPSAIGAGYNPVHFSEAIEPETKERLTALFAPWGEQPEVAEADLEAYAIISAMGPTYFWYQIQALRELGVTFGLTREATDEAVTRMLTGALGCLLEKGPASMDLIPVRPLAELEPTVREAYESKLSALYAKLSPAAAVMAD
jgi:pyrroline-5-carboxylate reductase